MIAQGRRAVLVGDELVIGRKHRVGIRAVAIGGNAPFGTGVPNVAVRTRATHRDAVGDLLGRLVDLDIRIPARRAALGEIRRALEVTPLDLDVPRPKSEDDGTVGDTIEAACDIADCAGDTVDCGDTISSCDLPSCDLPSCDVPSCDIPCDVPCDAGCF